MITFNKPLLIGIKFFKSANPLLTIDDLPSIVVITSFNADQNLGQREIVYNGFNQQAFFRQIPLIRIPLKIRDENITYVKIL